MRLSIALILIITPSLNAADIPAPTALDAEQAVALALSQNNTVISAERRAAASVYRARATTAFALPQLSGQASATRADGTYNAGRRPDEDMTRFALSGEASQLLYSFGAISAARKSAAAQRDAGQTERNLVKMDVAYSVRTAVADVLLARKVLAIVEARVAQRTSERNDAAGRVRAGLAAESELRQGDIGVANAEDDRLLALSDLESRSLFLAEQLSRPHGSIAVAGELARPANLPQWIAKGEAHVNQGTELAALSAQRRSEEADLATQKAARWPTLSAFAGGGHVGRKHDDLDDGWEAGLRVDWSLYDGGKRYALARAAKQSVQAVTAQAEATRLARLREAADLRQRGESLARRIDLQERVILLATKNYEDIRAQYNAGTVTQTRLNETNLVVFEALLAAANLVYAELQLVHAAQRLAE